MRRAWPFLTTLPKVVFSSFLKGEGFVLKTNNFTVQKNNPNSHNSRRFPDINGFTRSLLMAWLKPLNKLQITIDRQ